jgi:ketosteroid isomerase-like protein
MSSDTTAAIRQLEERRYKAMCEADIDTLSQLLDDSLVYTHSTASTDTKASYLAGIRAKKWQYRKIDRPVEDIRVNGDCAVITGQVRIEIAVDGKPKTLNSRFTNVWLKSGKGWRMVAWQSTPIPA